MNDFATYALHDGVALVTLTTPPVNGLGLGLRDAIVAALDRALADDAVARPASSKCAEVAA